MLCLNSPCVTLSQAIDQYLGCDTICLSLLDKSKHIISIKLHLFTGMALFYRLHTHMNANNHRTLLQKNCVYG